MKNQTLKNRLKKTDFIYVSIQFVLFIAYVLEFNITSLSFVKQFQGLGYVLFSVGILLLLIALLQLNTNLSPFPTPKNNSALIKTGVYKFIRHPIYTGIVIAFLGYAFLSNSIYKTGITILLLLLFYFKSKYEEKRLEQVFEGYINYKNNTGRFLPKILLISRKNHK